MSIDIEETLLRIEQNIEEILEGTSLLAATMGDAIQLRGSRVGGSVGQYLRKTSSTDHDFNWATIQISEVSGLVDALSDLNDEIARLDGLVAQRVRFVQSLDAIPLSRHVTFSTGGPAVEDLVYNPNEDGRAVYSGTLWDLVRQPLGGWRLLNNGSPVYFNATDSELIPPTTGWVDELNAPATVTLAFSDGTPGNIGTVWIGRTMLHFCTAQNVWRSTGELPANI